jgi:hypothetical protein
MDRLTPMEQAVTISIRARLASISISSTLHRQSISHVNKHYLIPMLILTGKW